MANLTITSLYKSFGAENVLDGIDLDIKSGEFLVLLGPSGCGKSTLLRIMAGLEDESAGDIAIDGKSIAHLSPSKREIAMVFQTYALYPHLNVRGNMELVLKQAGYSKTEIKKRVAESARALELEPLMDRKPSQLSGGQRQRVAIGRAIVRDPKIFLFDEPLSNLDAALRGQVRLEIARLHQRLSATMVYVTHDQVEAMTLADRIVVMNGGEVQQIGTPRDLYERPANLFVASFIGSPNMNFLKLQKFEAKGCQLHDGSWLPITSKASVMPANVTLGIRPSHCKLHEQKAEGFLPGKVLLEEYLGDTTFVHVELDTGEHIVVREDPEINHKTDDAVYVELTLAGVHLFNTDTGNRMETSAVVTQKTERA
ncbi:sn-glycerol-3-phosphate ABC transporter ATP-binding protein UgpC [Pseudovibrio sp. Tun.PSC04-5.I4]|uniref:ABC transporter ATP-binding protein n=1 Tax=Pseudovibrio sp. Tun.PSC04-5.I4 TaxID=1798213 RepID=UPI00088FB52E|nr:sn-glycerol-3-phosphate ABC transporter ATP-binding protein UgpC [Pseudovibrio sp. Tun.PSC04-5.I4]SDR20798.1 carbohydrate ABC transporter ATP-binding protein, CUT1 family [Pseudovibrio sp. Tun.PSC04-5.I4]